MTFSEKITYLNSKETQESLQEEYDSFLHFKHKYIHYSIISIFLIISSIYFGSIMPPCLIKTIILTSTIVGSVVMMIIARRAQMKFWFYQKLYYLSVCFLEEIRDELKGINITSDNTAISRLFKLYNFKTS